MLLITSTTLLRDPPRALSTDTADPRWHPHAAQIGPCVIVELDGEPVRGGDLCTYDVDAGQVVACKRDGAGSILLTPGQQSVALKTIFGRVSVRWNSDAIQQLVSQHDLEAPAGYRCDVTAIV